MRKTSRGTRRPVATAVTLTLLAALAGCGASPSVEAGSSSSPAVTSASPKPKPKPAGTVITTTKGSYLQAPAPAVKYSQSIVDPTARAAFTPEEIASGVKFITDFIAHQGIDSPLNGGGQTVEAFMRDNGHLFHPAYVDEAVADLKKGDAVVIQESWQKQYKGAYKYITSADTPRVRNLSIKPTVVWALPASGKFPTKALAVKASVSYWMKVVPGVGATGTGNQKSKGTMTYSIDKSPETGRWQITGYQHKVNTTEG